MVAAILIMWGLTGTDFMSLGNFQSMAYQLPELGVLTLAMMIAMLTSGINLSIIATANLSGIVMALILTKTFPPESALINSPWLVVGAILTGLLVAIIVGLINGFLIAVLDISPILATLGMMILLGGVSLVLTDGYVISGFSPTMLAIGNKDWLGIPVPMIIFLACAGFMSLILNKTPLGTRIYMFGSNPVACFYSGVNNKVVLFRTYIISGIFSGIAAIIMISRFNSAKADYGESYLLLTILAAVLGGVSAAGGFGKVSGLIISLVILQMISSGLNLMGISNFFTLALWGIVLIFVMIVKYVIDIRAQKRWNA
ncbi:MAG: sugar ABC transporter permease [Anaerolinea sp.]|nr:sugar ABC transporter permease [Anaerolinea sp.]